MAIDVCLVTSILVMAFRYAKSSRAHVLLPRIIELEGRISVLMAETEGRAKHLTDQLIRREQNLSRYITDIERQEKDMQSSVREAEDLIKELSLVCEGARREAAELERVMVDSRRMYENPREPEVSGSRKEHESQFHAHDDAMIAEPSDDVTFSTRRGSRRAEEWLEDAREVVEPRDSIQSTKGSFGSLRDSYKVAEEMLKEGKALEEVSRRTSLPIEGVQRLAQMIEIERDEVGKKETQFQVPPTRPDPRLGALGLSRRVTSAR